MRFSKIFPVLFLLLALALSSLAQGSRSLKDLPAGQTYVSTTEYFSIALPRNIFTYGKREKVGPRRDGRAAQTTWSLNEGIVDLARIEYGQPVIGKGGTLADYMTSEKNITQQLEKSYRLTGESFISSETNKGYELTYLTRTGSKLIRRYFPVGNSEYIIEASVSADVPGAEKLLRAALDSFRILRETNEYVAPGKISAGNDRTDNALAGPVKCYLFEQEKDGVSPREKYLEYCYDKYTGNIIKKVNFWDGKPLSEYNVIFDPVTSRMTETVMVFSPPTTFYELREYSEIIITRNAAGQVASYTQRDKDGKLASRVEYTYKDKYSLTQTSYDRENKKDYISEYTLNEKNTVLKCVSQYLDTEKGTWVTTVTDYLYLSYDARGNWTKRAAVTKDKTTFHYSTLTYWDQ